MPKLIQSLTAQDLDALDRDRTVIFFPVGPLEDHGPHLPLGLDLMEAEKLCTLTAERLEQQTPPWTTLLMPTLSLGIQSNTTRLAITVRGHVLRDWLVDACVSLNRRGFRYFVCYSGHLGPRQVTAIEEANQLIRKRISGGWLRRLAKGWKKVPMLIPASSTLVDPADVKHSPLWPDPSEHGGARDTSIALALGDAIARPSYAGLPAMEREGTRNERFRSRMKHERAGYWGAPAQGTRETGERLLKEAVEGNATKIRAALEGAQVEGLFKSWYSVFPPNRSFFAAWIMSFILGIMLLFWVYISFTMMTEPG